MNHPFWGYPTVYGNPIFSITSISLRYLGSLELCGLELPASQRVRRFDDWPSVKKGGFLRHSPQRMGDIQHESNHFHGHFAGKIDRFHMFSWSFFAGKKPDGFHAHIAERSRRRFWIRGIALSIVTMIVWGVRLGPTAEKPEKRWDPLGRGSMSLW